MNLWNQKGLPHKGWTCVNVEDRREDGQSEDEADYGSCEMCGNEKLRYVHIMNHSSVSYNVEVGCMCAEKMSDDYLNPERKEKVLRNKAGRRSRWLKRNWKLSVKGNFFMKIEGHHLLIFQRKDSKWGYKMNETFGDKTYQTKDQAKLALFDKFWDQTQI